MIKNKKGFILAEAIIVAVFVLGLFTYLAINIFPLFSKYDKVLKYDNPNEIYLANVLYEELESYDGEYKYLTEGLYTFNNGASGVECSYEGDIGSGCNTLGTPYFTKLIYDVLKIKRVLIFDAGDGFGLDEKKDIRELEEYYNYISKKNEFKVNDKIMMIEYQNGTFSFLVDQFASSSCFTAETLDIHGSDGIKITDYNEGACGNDVVIPSKIRVKVGEEWKFKDVIEIGKDAFRNSTIKTLAFDENSKLEKIGKSAFHSCGDLSSVEIPKSVRTIDDYAFLGTESSQECITSVKFKLDESGNSMLERIGKHAFAFNKIKGKVEIPKSVKTIDDYAFNDSLNNDSVLTFEEGINLTIGTGAFSENKIGKVIFPETGNIEIGNSAFRSSNILKSISLGAVSKIGNLAFETCGFPDDSLEISNNVEEIGFSAFQFSSLNTLTFEEGSNLKTIGDQAFIANLSGTIKIPGSVRSIGEHAFVRYWHGSNSISEVIFEGGTEPLIIGPYAFEDNLLKKELVLPSNVKEIGDYAFSGTGSSQEWNAITSVKFKLDKSGNSMLERIGKYAFAFNQIKGEVVIPSSVRTIDDYAFYSNDDGRENQISSIVFAFDESKASKLKRIGKHAFDNNKLQGELIIPASVTIIGEDAFSGGSTTDFPFTTPTNQLTSVIFQEGSQLEIIEPFAFANNQIRGELIIPNNPNKAIKIQNRAFQLNFIDSVILPKNIKSIGERAFYNSINHDLNHINIDMKESEFISNVSVGENWYSGSPTIQYRDT